MNLDRENQKALLIIKKQQTNIYVYNILIGAFVIAAVGESGWTTTGILVGMIAFWLFQCALLYIKIEQVIQND